MILRSASFRAVRLLARYQLARPWAFIGLVLALSAVGALLAARLELRLRFEQLLPDNRPSVVELARLKSQVRAGSHAFVVVEGGNGARQRVFADALVARIRGQAPGWLVDASSGVQEARSFLLPRAGLFLELSELERLRDDVEARWSWEVGRALDTSLDDDPPPELSWEALRRRFGRAETEPFPRGYYQLPDESALVVVVDTTINTGELASMAQALTLVKHAAELERRAYPELRLSYAGDLVTGLAEYGAVTQDLLSVGVLGVGLVIGVVLLYFWRLQALVALSLTLLAGLSLTFGITELAIGELNVATGFLVSIVAGNGINFGIIFLARYYEERRAGADLGAALELSLTQTWPGTLAGALAAAAAYGSLGVSEFRAFRDFALIGAAGMACCFLLSYLLLPALLVVLERSFVATAGQRSPARRLRRPDFDPGASLSRLVARAPRFVTGAGVILGLVGALALVPYIRADPLEYDMRRMQNDFGSGSEMYRASKLAARVLGAKLDSAMVMLANRPEQIPLLKRALEARRDRAPRALQPFAALHTAFDFVPSQQAEKLPLLRQIAERVRKAHARGLLSHDDFASIEAYLPTDAVRPFSLPDLPASVARPFTDRAGVVGRLMLIEPTAGQSDADVKYLMRWADSFRTVPLPDGDTLHGSGRAVIFADILATVLHDIPRSVALAFAMTILATLISFRRGLHTLIVLGSLVLGLGWVALAVSAFGLKINFFNFVALPVSIGIGVDYAVNLMQRYSAQPERGILAALRGTGGAVVLCSLTTILGYLALLFSVNQAIRSLGALAVLGEVGCLFSATLVLPAFLYWREQRAAPGARHASAASQLAVVSTETSQASS